MANGTYAPPDATAPDLYKVRFLARDTGPTTFHLADPEILFLLSEANDDVYLAAAEVAESVASIVAGGDDSVTSRSVGDLSITKTSGESRAAEYRNLAKRLRDQSTRHAVPTPISTAKSRADKVTREADTDLNRGSFGIGMHDNDTALTTVDWTERRAD